MSKNITVKELKDYINSIDSKYDELTVTVPEQVSSEYATDCYIKDNISGWLDTYRNTYHIDMWLD